MNKLLEKLGYEIWIQLARLYNPKRRNALFVVLAGKPNAGKGTVAERLSGRNKIPQLSTGNLLRAEIAANTEIGREWAPLMKQGKLVPDHVIFHLLQKELAKPEYNAGAILDGFPRTVEQAKMLRKMLAWRGNKVDIVILLNVSEQDVIERMALRRTCTKCGKTYHLKFSPPKAEGLCDVEGAAIVQRDDDRPEILVTRLQEFDAKFAPLHSYYSDLGLLVTVQSRNDLGIEKTFEAVMFAVDEVD